MRLAPIISLTALGAVCTLAACASTPPRQYGQYSALQPRFAVVGKEGSRPEQLTVTLNQPAYVTVLFVVPGRGSVVIYPTDSTTQNHLSAGTQQITVNFPKPPARDSLFRRRTNQTTDRRRGGRTGNSQPAITRDTSPRFLPDTSLGIANGGYILMVASTDSLSYSALRHRTEGITIPLEDDEALNTVVKLVRGTMPEDAAWAGLSKEIDVDQDFTAPRTARQPGRN